MLIYTFLDAWKLTSVEKHDQAVAEAYQIISTRWSIKRKRAETCKHEIAVELRHFILLEVVSFGIKVPCGHTIVDENHLSFLVLVNLEHYVIEFKVIVDMAGLMNYL